MGKYEGVINESIYIVNGVLDVMRHQYLCDKFLRAMIIPIDANNEMYTPRCERIEFNCAYCGDSEEWIDCAIDIQPLFHVEYVRNYFNERTSDNKTLIYRTAGRFDRPYKKVMKALYKALRKQFTELNFVFDGSRIMFDNPYIRD